MCPFGKMSGRGLGHTGGTLDKLESITRFRIKLSNEEFVDQVREVGLAIIGQSPASSLPTSASTRCATLRAPWTASR